MSEGTSWDDVLPTDTIVSASQPQDLLDIQKEMSVTIDEFVAYTERQSDLGGLDWGFPSLNKAMDGLQPGLILFAGGPNTGKTAICLQAAYRIAQANRNPTPERPDRAYVLYFSLDDNSKDVLPRVIAQSKAMPINAVKAPRKYLATKENAWDRLRAEGIQELRDMLDCFKVIDSTQGSSLTFIEEQIKIHRAQLKQLDKAYRIVVVIDNYHDITCEKRFDGEQERWAYIANELSNWCTRWDMPIICTAELKKLGGNRRPIAEDVRESIKLGYEAKAILLCYNEVGLRQNSAKVYFTRGGCDEHGDPYGETPQPVLEVMVAKNKFSSFKHRLFFEFFPERSWLREPSDTRCAEYRNAIDG
jgi:replicative DNA helicase